MEFIPNFKHVVDAALNRKPQRLPLYEHIISVTIMEEVLGTRFAEFEFSNNQDELRHFFKNYCLFFKEMTYDTVSYEFSIISILPAQGAGITGKAPGIIQNRDDFNRIDWDSFVQKYIAHADTKFHILGECMPAGMSAIGGVANGVFEISEELVGMEYLSYMQVDDPELFRDVYKKIGDLMVAIWNWFLKKYGCLYCVCRFGDDLGYKSGLLVSPQVVQQNIMPQYHRIINMVHQAGLPFLWHSCGNIFEIMDAAITAGINAKHSNENAIAQYDEWIERYGRRIGLFGGIDVDLLCQLSSDEVYNHVIEIGTRFRAKANGYAIGSGNSIPNYVPLKGYLAMIKAAQEIRRRENTL